MKERNADYCSTGLPKWSGKIGVVLCLILLLVLPSYAQLPTLQEQVKDGVAKVQQRLQQVHHMQDSLLATQDKLLQRQAVLDSLAAKGIDASLLASQADSLLQSQQALQQLQSTFSAAEGKLEEQILGAKEALYRYLPEEKLQQMLAKLKEAGNMNAADPTQFLSKLSSVPALPSMQLPQTPALPITGSAFQAQANQQTMAMAADLFSGYESHLSKATTTLNKYKGRFESLQQLQDMPKGFFGRNPLKDKPWTERLLVGVLWQVSKQQLYKVDIGPTLAWRLTDRLAIGTGGQYRLSLNLDKKPWLSREDRVLGYYAFTDVELLKGFFGRMQFENLHTAVPRLDPATRTESSHYQWVKGFSVGIGKSYTLYKLINGYALMQYNVLHESGKTPYLQPLQAKVGFYLNGLRHVKAKAALSTATALVQ